MIQEADVVIIGAGSFGSSIAFHLAKAGKKSIALIDKAELASQTSPRAAGNSHQIRSTDLMTRMAIRSVEKIKAFEAETGEPIVYYQTGRLQIALSPENAQRLHAEIEPVRGYGLNLRAVSNDEACRMFPFLETKNIRAASYLDSDLYFEPVQLPLGYARAAGKLGATSCRTRP